MKFINSDITKKLKLATAIIETILALTGVWSSFMMLFFIMHAITLFFSLKIDAPKMWSIMWVFINIIWWMPLAWIAWRTLHMVTAILLWFDYSRMKSLEDQEIQN